MSFEIQETSAASFSDERIPEIANCIRKILDLIGEDSDREGLLDTPSRVARMYMEIFSGLAEDPRDHLLTQFCDDRHEDVVIVKDIAFYSFCEHHLVPFFGKMHVAYIPDEGRLTGLSKIARVVDTLARRPQLQERLNTQVVETIWEVLRPKGVLVLAEAEHMCMAMRGIRMPGSTTITMVSKGSLKTDLAQRSEVLKMIRSQ